MNALLSIKPEFAKGILSGEKRYEFRRQGFQNPEEIDFVIMYASSPVQRIVGYFSIGNTVDSEPKTLWNSFGHASGLKRNRFMDYFSGAETGCAIEVTDPHQLDTPIDPRDHVDEFQPPVSYKYVNGEFDFVFQDRRIPAQ